MRLLPAGALVAGALAVAGCGSSPQVTVHTYAGPMARALADEDEPPSPEEVRAFLRTLFAPSTPDQAAAPRPGSAPVVAHPPTTAQELDSLVQAVRTGPIVELAGPAARVAAARPEVWPEVRALMLGPRKGHKGEYRSLLAAIGGDVPNRYGTFLLHWKKDHGYPVRVSEDWYGDLLALPRSKVSRALRGVYRDCVLETALFRAAAGMARARPALAGEVVTALLDAAYIQDGTFRDEVGRAIRSMGDVAVPHLVRASLPPKGAERHPDTIPARKARYAAIQLDLMERGHPKQAIEALGDDPHALADLLDAYGTRKLGEAASFVLDLVDHDEAIVRRAARRAFLAYVEGPPPRARHRSVRTLGGGTRTARAALSYRARATLAIRDKLDERAPDLLEPPCEIRRPDGTYDQACLEQPLRHTRTYFEWLDVRRHGQQRQRLAAALATEDPEARLLALRRLLLLAPEIGADAKVQAVFVTAAQEAEAAGAPARAARLYRRAAHMIGDTDPERAHDLQVAALRQEASLPDLSPAGRVMLAHTASVLAGEGDALGGDALAAAALAPAAGPADGPSLPRVALGTFAAALALLCLSLLGAPLRRALVQR